MKGGPKAPPKPFPRVSAIRHGVIATKGRGEEAISAPGISFADKVCPDPDSTTPPAGAQK